MGKVKDLLWDEYDAEQKYSEYMDSVLDTGRYAYDVSDDWILSPTEDMCGIGIDNTWYVEADEKILERGLGADVLQKINKKVKEMGGDISYDDEIPF